MNNSVSRSIEIIERTPNTLLALLQGLDDFWTLNNYGESSFSPFDVVGHLIQADRTNWIPRLRVILEHRNSQPFPGFDRYRMYEDSKGKSMTELLNAFGEIRRLSIDTLKELNLDEEQLKYAGLHPQMGEVTLSQLIAAWVVHDLGHIHQIAKSMAYQYRNEVGPWKKYLTILPR